MAVNKKNEKLVIDRLVVIDDSIDLMEDLGTIQQDVFKELSMLLIKELDLDINGNIKRSRKNQKAAQKFSKIKRLVLTPEYKLKVGRFINSFDTVKKMSDIQIKES